MSYIANRYNYCSPLSSAPGLFNEDNAVQNLRYFNLADNVLDGSCVLMGGNVGLWDSITSDADGNLSSPYIITVTEPMTVNAFRLISNSYCFPVAFTVEFYNEGSLIYSIDETANTAYEYVYYMPATLQATSYVISITKLSRGNSVACVYNTYNPGYVKRSDEAVLVCQEACNGSALMVFTGSDNLRVGCKDTTHIINHSFHTDSLVYEALDTSSPINVHTRMKDPSRRVYGKVYVTYTDPMLSSETTVDTSDTAYNSSSEQVIDGNAVALDKVFKLYENNLTGEYIPIAAEDQVGWTSAQVSGPDGMFSEPYPYVRINFASRPITNLTITFGSDAHPVDFAVDFLTVDGTSVTKTFSDYDSSVVTITDKVADVVAITLTVHKVSKEGYPVTVLEMPLMSTIAYEEGSANKLMSIDLLEELTYEDDIEALGGVSANETTIVFDNSDRAFFFNNKDSLVASQLKRNRKIVPWLGVKVLPDEIEWYSLGTYWTYKWSVPVNGLTATAVAFDTLGLLDTTDYTDHYVLVDKSLGELIEYVLTDAKKTFAFIEYRIDPALYNITIPFAWFERGSHTAALRKISQCYPMHIYCDRDGNICAAPQRLDVGYHYDAWSDSTNVISKSYSSLYTTLPNIISVTAYSPVVTQQQLVTDNFVFNVGSVPTRTLNFSSPYVSDLVVEVDCDASVQYTYVAYSWGIEFIFTGYGNVRSITCSGNIVDISNSAVITRRDEDSIRLNGAVTRDISSDFIQTSDHAILLLDRLSSLSEDDKYDATVDYRGDISLTINDPILLYDGIAPNNRYIIKRHQLYWNGALSGSAELNT